ncbi:MAG: DUF1854 domain-containing protein [Clostridiales bacterium]|nr:DUF1854 domain-containing protein [Clostridiales bacterium]
MSENAEPRGLVNVIDIGWLDAGGAEFYATPGGFIGLRYKGSDYRRVTLRRALPVRSPLEFISVADADNSEIGIIRDVGELSGPQAQVVLGELDKRYFCPYIYEVASVKDKLGYVYMELLVGASPPNGAARAAGEGARAGGRGARKLLGAGNSGATDGGRQSGEVRKQGARVRKPDVAAAKPSAGNSGAEGRKPTAGELGAEGRKPYKVSAAVKDVNKNIRMLDADRLIIFDVDGNRFMVNSIAALDRRSLKALEPYMF